MDLEQLSDKYVREITEIYRDIETELIYKIADQFKTLEGLEVEPFLVRLRNLNVINEYTLQIIAKLTGKPLNEVVRYIRSLGIDSIDYETLNKAYEQGFISIDPNDIAIRPILDIHVRRMKRDMQYIQEQTRAGVYRDTYLALERARLSVETGLDSPNNAIAKAVKSLANKGITSNTFLREGKEVHQNMEGVVRRAVRTSFTDTMAEMNENVGNEIGAEHWYMSQHMGARTTGDGYENHAEWQGKVYETSELTTVCGKGEDRGYLGYNCRHMARPFIKGVSVEPPPLLNMEELERVYTLEQKQRTMERNIRHTKREIEALSVFDNEDAEKQIKMSKVKLKRQQMKLREYIKENDDVLRRDYSRERIITR